MLEILLMMKSTGLVVKDEIVRILGGYFLHLFDVKIVSLFVKTKK